MTVMMPLVAAVLGENKQRLNDVLAVEYTPGLMSSIMLLFVSIKNCRCALRKCGRVCSSVPVTSVTRHDSVGPKNPFVPFSYSMSTPHPVSIMVIWGVSVPDGIWWVMRAWWVGGIVCVVSSITVIGSASCVGVCGASSIMSITSVW